jgi:phosphoribosyl 1,2-cyclic phosphodiesterase
MRIKFWGVRGSVPSPLDGAAVEAKVRRAIERSATMLAADSKVSLDTIMREMPFTDRSTFGGNTSCVEVQAGGNRIVLDMGTGLRMLGNSLFGEMFQRKGLPITFLVSHVHWDHIQGVPFFGPLYINKATGINNEWTFYGGTDWQKDVEVCLRGQMDAPTFPVSWKEIEQQTGRIETYSVHDMKRFVVGQATVSTRKLSHPQETYGYRIEHDGKVFVYTTDNEPYDPLCPDPRLLALCKGADVWVTDCQYTKGVYEGTEGGKVPRHSWGHSYPEAVAATAKLGKVRKTILFHHDPSSTDEQIVAIAAHCQSLVEPGQEVVAAYEGLVIDI